MCSGTPAHNLQAGLALALALGALWATCCSRGEGMVPQLCLHQSGRSWAVALQPASPLPPSPQSGSSSVTSVRSEP